MTLQRLERQVPDVDAPWLNSHGQAPKDSSGRQRTSINRIYVKGSNDQFEFSKPDHRLVSEAESSLPSQIQPR